MKCALLQFNPKVGDLAGNGAKIFNLTQKAWKKGATLAVTSELALLGYPPRDLLLYPSFVEEARLKALEIAQKLKDKDITLILGTVGQTELGRGRALANQALVIASGAIEAVYAKRLLPTYDVFDEARYFEPGQKPLVIERSGQKIAITICEDIWNDEAFWPRPLYALDPLSDLGPFDILVNLSASPFSVGKQQLRENMLAALTQKTGAQALYANQVGANDELIFDGRGVWVAGGQVLARGQAFAEDLLIVDLANPPEPLPQDALGPEEETWEALSLGVSDYCAKNNLKTVILGLSGGIDSALTAAIASKALGPENVYGLVMPSPHSSDHSVYDALALSKNLGLAQTSQISITPIMMGFDAALKRLFQNSKPGVAEENIQARSRGSLLMAVSNKFGHLLLTTGNKSEISVGYCTIYGDMCGALAVIGDLYKTEVFRLARWVNREKIVIPENTLNKPPSAELRPDQKDQDSLPPYEVLDAILKCLLEERLSPKETAKIHDPKITFKVATLIRAAEFKRRQAAPVLKITGQAFGVGWRMPISCRSVFTVNK
ncbi:MAG: NAD+ synthase [Deltaproteobacteria bacterium]|jgi:NAD+ synthase/NAD+ synthase (glutamine-hydrolysing)|nr:NAD+ synthase [Deltaproteobacteria bacterium]